MKKGLSILISVLLVLSCFSVPVYAEETPTNMSGVINLQDLEENGIKDEDIMTFEEMVTDIAQKKNITYEEALELLPEKIKANAKTRSANDIGYITKKIVLYVTEKYHPKIEFYCEIAYGGNFYNLTSIYNVELNRGYGSVSKQFKGTLKTWLRSAQSIEYSINGDFYNNGTTNFTGGLGVSAGINELVQVDFHASITTENNHYKYFYEHETKVLPF